MVRAPEDRALLYVDATYMDDRWGRFGPFEGPDAVDNAERCIVALAGRPDVRVATTTYPDPERTYQP
jgi:hypothetical protein